MSRKSEHKRARTHKESRLQEYLRERCTYWMPPTSEMKKDLSRLTRHRENREIQELIDKEGGG